MLRCICLQLLPCICCSLFFFILFRSFHSRGCVQLKHFPDTRASLSFPFFFVWYYRLTRRLCCKRPLGISDSSWVKLRSSLSFSLSLSEPSEAVWVHIKLIKIMWPAPPATTLSGPTRQWRQQQVLPHGTGR